jgi:hypothetical protein
MKETKEGNEGGELHGDGAAVAVYDAKDDHEVRE